MTRVSTILITSSVLLFFLNQNLTAQISNGGFEEWSDIDCPNEWQKPSDDLYVRFERDTISVEGDYSLKAIPADVGFWEQCSSIISTSQRFTNSIGENKSFTFYVKAESLNLSNEVWILIDIDTFRDSIYVETLRWRQFEPVEEFTRIQIPFSDPSINRINIEIQAAQANAITDGCSTASHIWFDAFSIEETEILSNEDLISVHNHLAFYPNPTSSKLYLNTTESNQKNYIEIYNMNGEMVVARRISSNSIDITHLNAGYYYLKMYNQNNIIVNQLLVKQ